MIVVACGRRDRRDCDRRGRRDRRVRRDRRDRRDRRGCGDRCGCGVCVCVVV